MHKKLCKDSKEHATKIISYEKKNKLRLTTGDNKLYRKQKTCHICKKEFNTDNNYKKYYKVIDHS